ncbi:MAG TPA: CHAT domain-containing protein, partial [Blastocatellia bacterium]|nr:CHAT domain-containing protein [Blastocatellia bacterium]
MLNEAGADIREGVAPALLARERELREQLNGKAERLSRLLGDKKMAAHVEAARKELQAALTRHQEALAQIRASSPRYAALTQPAPLGLKEIQSQVLDPETILLEYALGKERSYLWAVTTDSLTSYTLPKQAEIEEAARRVYKAFSSADAPDTDAAARLSRILLGPVAAQLGTKRLLVVAEGALQYIPFGALPVPAAQAAGDRKQEAGGGQPSTFNPSRPPTPDPRPLVIARHEVVMLPSATTLAVLRQEMAGREPAPQELAVLADPVFGSDDPRVALAAEARAQRATVAAVRPAGRELERSAEEMGLGVSGFERLLSTRREAEEILALAQAGRSLKALDFQASLTTATGPQLGQYRIIHFATHGLLNSRHPELSGLVLSLVDEHGQPQNGFLRAHEVYNMKLAADLVVLSGCQTALGKYVRGEGLVGLTRGFMYAGTPRVVASMWRVPDRATAELMKRFYTGLFKEGLRPAAALRAAQVAMSKEKRWAAPYYWAAFTLQGEWR